MVNPSYNGSFKFPSRSIGSRKSSKFGGRQSARIVSFNKRNPMMGSSGNPCPAGLCFSGEWGCVVCSCLC
jgi:hypothetical protein